MTISTFQKFQEIKSKRLSNFVNFVSSVYLRRGEWRRFRGDGLRERRLLAGGLRERRPIGSTGETVRLKKKK